MRRLLEIILFIAIAMNIASALCWHGKWYNIPTGFHLTMTLSLICDYIKMNKNE
jgi:hypothetical protein